MAQAPLLTLIFHGSFGAYRKDGNVRTTEHANRLFAEVGNAEADLAAFKTSCNNNRLASIEGGFAP
jgi:hypothetical protein